MHTRSMTYTVIPSTGDIMARGSFGIFFTHYLSVIKYILSACNTLNVNSNAKKKVSARSHTI